MNQKRSYSKKRSHYALLLNRLSTNFDQTAVDKLISAIRSKGYSFSIFEPSSANELYNQARVALGLKRATRDLKTPYYRGGEVTKLVACGGDGTFNLAARAAQEKGIPIGLLPMGKFNNMGRYIYGNLAIETAVTKIIAGKEKLIDSGLAAGQPFFTSAGIGFIPRIQEELETRSIPKMSFSWSKIGAQAASEISLKKTFIKVDSFHFEIRPIIFNINLLPFSIGLALSPTSVSDDGRAEIIIDDGNDAGMYSSFIRQIASRKYLYVDKVRLFRGKIIICQPVKGRTLYLDGELLDIPSETLEIKIIPKKLRLIC